MAVPWLADVLRAAGLSVVEEGDWLARTAGGAFDPIGVLWHHTAARSSASDPAPALGTVINGRPDLRGPLCHALVDYHGVFHMISANRANHAGAARASGPIPAGDGNTMLIGWEIDYDGTTQSMTTAQYEASVTATATVLTRLGRNASHARGHRETSTTQKIDPSFVDLDAMRSDVAARMNGQHHPAGPVFHQVLRPDGSRSGFAPVPAPGGGPAVAVRVGAAGLADGSLLVVDVGPDGVVYHQLRRSDGVWTGFVPVPAPGSAAARAARVGVAGMADGSTHLVDIGADGVLYHQIRRPNGTWTGFLPVPAPGGAAAQGREVSIAAMPGGAVLVADIGLDGVVYDQIRRPDGTWTAFTPVPAPGDKPALGRHVSVAGTPDGAVQMVDVGPDGVLYHQIRRPNGTWTGFLPVPAPGGTAAHGTRTSIAGMPDGSAHLVDIGQDGVAYHQIRRADGSWSGFVPLAGPRPPAPANVLDVSISATPDGAAHLVIAARP